MLARHEQPDYRPTPTGPCRPGENRRTGIRTRPTLRRRIGQTKCAARNPGSTRSLGACEAANNRDREDQEADDERCGPGTHRCGGAEAVEARQGSRQTDTRRITSAVEAPALPAVRPSIFDSAFRPSVPSVSTSRWRPSGSHGTTSHPVLQRRRHHEGMSENVSMRLRALRRQ